MLSLFAHVLRLAGATAIAVAFCCARATVAPAKDFTEIDVKQAVDQVIAERSKDGAFVFHDPKLDADLNLVFEQVKVVRGMEGYGWFANVIFHDKDESKKQYAISWSPACPWPGGGFPSRNIQATWRSPAPGR